MMRNLLPLFVLVFPLVAADPPVDRKSLKPGLVASFTEFPERPQTTTIHRLEPVVAILLKPGESMHPQQAHTSTASWRGYIQIVTPGEYTFSGVVQAARVTVDLTKDGKFQEVYKADGPYRESKLISGEPVKLEQGFYRFNARFDFYRSGEKVNFAEITRRFELHWQGPGFQREPIPYFFFGHLPAQRGTKFENDARSDEGRFLIRELSCANCHHPEKMSAAGLAKPGPDLTKIGVRAFPGWLDAWLADPAKLRPHTRMPALFNSDDEGVAERYAVVQYLVNHGGALTPAAPPKLTDNNYAKSVQNGRALFSTTGCAACHGTKLAGTMKRNDDDDDPPPFDPKDSIYSFGSTTGAQSLYYLGGVGSKTTPDELAKFLKDPLKSNPHGKMPAMALSGQEAQDLARYLTKQTDENVSELKAPAWKAEQLAKSLLKDADLTAFLKQRTNEQWRDLGQRLFISKGCANCHAMEEKGKPLAAREDFPSAEKIAGSKKPSCAAAESKAVRYHLSEPQRALLRNAWNVAPKETPAPAYQARETLKRMNCLNCHFKDGEGGLGNELADAMKKLENSANEDDVQPPRLTGIGHKATSSWLQGVMLKNERARPWMTLRMPQYGDANVGHLVNGLPAYEGLPPEPMGSKPRLTAAMIDQGRKLVGKEGLGCAACHDISGYVGGGTRGPDLATTDRRVRQDWYGRWMHNPQRLVPGTKMPSNFTDGKSVSNLLNADANAQIDAIWNYLTLGPGLPLPTGLEPPAKGMPLFVKDRPEILRTFIPDSGTKSIAVGFPKGEGSYVFDAHACRIAYAWEGNFLDVMPVWDQRGGRQAKLLGPKFYLPPAVQPWAVTKGEKPDYDKQAKDYAFGLEVPFQEIYAGPMRVHFGGYSLDSAGVPLFRYRVDDVKGGDGVNIREASKPVRAGIGSGLMRIFEITGTPGKTNWFLIAETGKPVRKVKNMTVISLPNDRALAIDVSQSPVDLEWVTAGDKVMLKLPGDANPQTLGFTVWALPRDDDSLVESLEAKPK